MHCFSDISIFIQPFKLGVRSGNLKCKRAKGYETNQDDMAAAPDRVAILLPLGVAVTMAFSTVIIQALALMAIMHFVRQELRRGRAGVPRASRPLTPRPGARGRPLHCTKVQ